MKNRSFLDVAVAHDISGISLADLDRTLFAQNATTHLQGKGRTAPVWIVAAVVAVTWTSQLQASPDTARYGGSNDKAVQIAQETSNDIGTTQPLPQQEHHDADTLACELIVARHDIELLQSIEQAHDRTERLEQELAAAQRGAETQAALAAKAGEEVSRLKQAAESGAAELQKLLQQERERAGRLEQDLATARHGLEMQQALAAHGNAEAARLKQPAERSLELNESLQKEHERAEALKKELSMVRAQVYAYEAQGRSVGESIAAERARAERLEQNLAIARRDLEVQASLSAKASEEAAQIGQAAQRDLAELRRSLQQERGRAERLEADLASARRQETAALLAETVGQTAVAKAVETGATPTDDGMPAAASRGGAQLNPDEAVAAARLVARAGVLLGQGDIGAARSVLERAADIGSAEANFVLAETYDPQILPKWGTYGTRGDALKARTLYAKADAAGITEAKHRMEALHR